MKKFFFVLILLLLGNGAIAQTNQPCSTCLPEGITFNTQAQIDNFQTNYPNCTEILGGVTIYGNDIANLNGLSGLISIDGSLTIGDWLSGGNPSLTSLTGLDNIDAGTITDLSIYDNYNLSICEVQSICDYLAAPNGTVEIYNNATGCNSEEEVEEACIVGVDESSVGSWQSAVNIYPNPTSTTFTISTPTTPNKNTFVTIYNLNGQQLIKREMMEPQTVVDVSGLYVGIYFVKVISDDGVSVGKFMKK